jgi:hypothetical protein
VNPHAQKICGFKCPFDYLPEGHRIADHPQMEILKSHGATLTVSKISADLKAGDVLIRQSDLRSHLLRYEIAGSAWWVGWIGMTWAQNLAAKYFAWKVSRKLRALRRNERIKQVLRFKGYDI